VLLDDVLPRYRWSDRYATTVAAPSAAVLDAVRGVTAAEMPLVGVLMAARGLPSRMRGRPGVRDAGPALDALLRSGFALLAEAPDELVVGIVGRFWQACPDNAGVRTAEELGRFEEPGWAKAAMNFTVEEVDGGRTRLATETRIATTDAESARRFGLYWTFVRPGSGLIRRLWLRAVRLRAERAVVR
jgi:hypothetical protein